MGSADLPELTLHLIFIQMKSLVMNIANKKLSFDVCTVGDLLNIVMEH